MVLAFSFCVRLTFSSFVSAGLQSDHDDPEGSGTQRGSSGLGDALRAVGRALCGGDRNEKTGMCVCVLNAHFVKSISYLMTLHM